MPREQQGGITKGGGMHPYVAAMSQQRSSQKTGMREAAMAAETSRQNASTSAGGGVAQAGIQAAAARDMQDRRSAEEKIGRAADQEFARTMAEAEQQNVLQRDALLNELENAREQRQLDRILGLEKKLDAQSRVQNLNDMTFADNTRKIAMSLGELNGRSETAKAGLVVQRRDELGKYQQMNQMYDTSIDQALIAAASQELSSDTTDMDMKTLKLENAKWSMRGTPEFGGGMQLRRGEPSFTGKSLTDTTPPPTMDTVKSARFSAGINKAFTSVGAGTVNVDTLSRKNIQKFKEQVQKGEIPAEQLVPVIAVLKTARKAMIERATEASRGKDEKSNQFYTDKSAMLLEAETMLRSLENDKTPMVGSDKITVGSIVKQATKWAAEEFDDDQYEIEVARLDEQMRTETKKFRDTFSTDLGFATTTSPFLTPSDLSNPLVMDRLMQQKNFVYQKMPGIVP
jgi:hypothetical protein